MSCSRAAAMVAHCRRLPHRQGAVGSSRPPPQAAGTAPGYSSIFDKEQRRRCDRARTANPHPHRTGPDLDSYGDCGVFFRRPVPRLRADSPNAKIRANDRDRGWVRWGGRKPERNRPPHESLLCRQITGHDAQRAQHARTEPTLTPGPIRFFAKSSPVARLRPLHPDTLAVGVDHHRIAGQHMSHACGLAHGGHDGHTEQAPGGRV